MNILCIDAGTFGMKGVIFDHTGQRRKEYYEGYLSKYLTNGLVEQDPADWECALYHILKCAAKEAEESGFLIDAVSFTSFRSAVIATDKTIRPLCPAIMWQDRRADALCEQLQTDNDLVFERSGAKINPVFSGIKMMWIREKIPDLYKNTYKFMTAADYMLYLMTGILCTDYTYGSRSNLMNLRECRWDPQLLEIFHVEESRLCRLVEPGSICGYTTERLCSLTGFPSGIPVVTAGGDQQCGALGQGVVGPGILSVTVGTGGFLVTNLKEIPNSLKSDVICNYSSVRNQYMIEYSVLTCCSAYDWFCREWLEGYTMEELDRMVESVPPGSNGCLCMPYFMGRSTPDWNRAAKGGFFDVTLSNTKWDMLRSLMEGICYEIRNGIDTMAQYVHVSDIFVNGGMTNSRPFNQMQADIYGKRIVRRGKADATARGALIAALKALGVYETEEEAFTMISDREKEQVFYPNESLVQFYEKCRKKMNGFYQKGPKN